MKDWIVMLWVFYLGFIIIALTGIDLFNWKYWVIMLPTMLLEIFLRNKYEKK